MALESTTKLDYVVVFPAHVTYVYLVVWRHIERGNKYVFTCIYAFVGSKDAKVVVEK